MTPKARVQAVLDGRPPDKVPLHHISFSSRIASAILGREAYVGGGIQRWREATALHSGADAHAEFIEHSRRDAIDIALACGLDLVRPAYWRDPRKPAARIDHLSFRYENPDGSWEIKRLVPDTELYNTIAASPRRPLTIDDLEPIVQRAEAAAEAHAPTPDTFADEHYALRRIGTTHAVRCSGPWTAIPIDEPAWLEATLLRPDLVARLLDTQVATSLKNLEILARMGARLCFGGGDFASDRGPIYPPRVFHELVLPRLQRISRRCRELGILHFFGSDGNVWRVADDLYAASGIDGHYELDRRAGMHIPEVHRRFPRLTMVGNISSHTLHVGTPDDVRAETSACLDEARATNKVIVGCSNMFVPETPMQNFHAMLETLATR